MMTAADAERWDARYREQPVPSARRPDALTDALIADLPVSGRALDVACGAGAQAAWLAGFGLDVIALDVSPAAIRLTQAATSTLPVQVSEVDLDDGIPTALGQFDVMLCQRFRAAHLYDAFIDRLVVGGVLIVTVLSETGAEHPGPFHAPTGELAAAFTRPDCDVLRHFEADGEESIVVRRI